MISNVDKKELEDAICSLSKILSLLDLEDILSQLDIYLPTLQAFQENRSQDKKEFFVRFLVYSFGTQLLANQIVRLKLATSMGITPLNNWNTGSLDAQKFCERIGIPRVFSGTKSFNKTIPIETISSRPSLNSLEDYQLEVLNKAKSYLINGANSLISIPTGSGKTRVATELVLELSERHGIHNIIWLAHTEELCEQAFVCMKQVFLNNVRSRELNIVRCWGSNLRRLEDGTLYERSINDGLSFSIFTVQSALRIAKAHGEGQVKKLLADSQLIITDEAHRAAASSYKYVYQFIKEQSSAPMLGLSATPVRATYSSQPYTGTAELRQIFPNLIEPTDSFPNHISATEALLDRGVLARINISRINIASSDLIEFILEKMKFHKKAILFSRTISEAQIIAAKLNMRGLASEAVSSRTSEQDRSNITQLFRKEDVKIICNCELLTTGFDAPSVDCLFLLRSTKSPVLYKQIIGRGLRGPKFGGSETCSVYLLNAEVPKETDLNTEEFARLIWD